MGIMTANQYRAALAKLNLTQAAAAEFLGISIRTSHGYANGEPIPEGYAKLLRLVIRLELKPDEVKQVLCNIS
jgi:transcriptional regulator with XRE-family HTH domain